MMKRKKYFVMVDEHDEDVELRMKMMKISRMNNKNRDILDLNQG
jgi:hypothetical protein